MTVYSRKCGFLRVFESVYLDVNRFGFLTMKRALQGGNDKNNLKERLKMCAYRYM